MSGHINCIQQTRNGNIHLRIDLVAGGLRGTAGYTLTTNIFSITSRISINHNEAPQGQPSTK
jgi:hypothetical protein